MRVIALVSLVLALSVSSLPVSKTSGIAAVSQLEDKVESNLLNGAKSVPNTPNTPTPPRSRAFPGSVGGAGAVPGQVKQVTDQVTGKAGAAKPSVPGISDPATVGNVKSPGAAGLGAVKLPGSRRGTGTTGVPNAGVPGNTLNEVKGAVSVASGKAAGTVPQTAGKVAPRNTVATSPGLGGIGGTDAGGVAAQAKQEATVVTSKVTGAAKGASVPGSPPAP